MFSASRGARAILPLLSRGTRPCGRPGNPRRPWPRCANPMEASRVERPPERRFFVLFALYWLPVLVYLTAILVVSSQPYLTPPFEFPNSDKLLHGIEYFGFGLLVARALRATMRIHLPLVAALAAMSFGIV